MRPLENILEQLQIHIQELLASHPNLESETCRTILSELETLNLYHIEYLGKQLNVGICICDKDGIIRYVNKNNEALVGIKRTDCIGKSYHTFTSAGGGISNVVIKQVLESEEVYSSLVYSASTGIQFLESGAPIYDTHGALIGAILIDQDVSDTIKLEERLKNTEEKLAQYRELSGRNDQIIQQLNQQSIVVKRHFSDLEEFKSPAIQAAYQLAYQASQTDVTTLLVGETGTGKEIITNYIFEHSQRSEKPFIKVNCAAIPEHLLESEMFGYVKGAFTGANTQGKVGLLELANHGTLFLDEIGELPLEFQAKLLRAIQQKEITKIGDTKIIKLDCRIIAATNRDLQEMVTNGTFRRDLFYRLNIFPIKIPALRDRKEDIPNIASHFLSVFNRKYNKNILFRSDVYDGLISYRWPGNIREMENIIERWAVIFESDTVIGWDKVKNQFAQDQSVDAIQDTHFLGRSLKTLTDNYERDILIWALKKYPTSRKAAAALGVNHSTVVRKAQALGIALTRRGNNSKPAT